MTVQIIKDNLKSLLKNIESMSKKSVLIGIPSDKTIRPEVPQTNAELGYLHEHGSPARNIPARPFLIPGVKAANENTTKILKEYAGKALQDYKAIDNGLNAAGLFAQNSVKKYIIAQTNFTPLSAATIAQRKAKGFKGTKALIRTGQLLNSITYVVKEKQNG